MIDRRPLPWVTRSPGLWVVEAPPDQAAVMKLGKSKRGGVQSSRPKQWLEYFAAALGLGGSTHLSGHERERAARSCQLLKLHML